MIQTIIVEETPKNEAQTINWYRSLGWELMNNQTVVTTFVQNNGNGGVVTETSKKVKLTFERDTNHPNYEVLNGYYNRCLPLFAEKQNYEKVLADGGSGKQWVINAIISVILGIIMGVGYEASRVSGGLFGHSFDGFMAMLSSFIGFIVVFIVCIIVTVIKNKKTLKPKLEKITQEIDSITSESAKYV